MDRVQMGSPAERCGLPELRRVQLEREEVTRSSVQVSSVVADDVKLRCLRRLGTVALLYRDRLSLLDII